jgi:lysozyme
VFFSFILSPKFKKKFFKSENTNISNTNYLFGIDISHHNGAINWEEVKKSKHPINYVFIKATDGEKFVDNRFHYNWEKATENGYIKGAYHFYRPDINSVTQFNNFSSTVKLEKGDLFPVLDIEKECSLGKDNLIKGIRNWINLCKKKYGVKPILYTGRKFYTKFLNNEFSDCPLWIASYTNEERVSGIDWDLHQFTKKVVVNGIPENVDGNNFKGNIDDLKTKYSLN